MELDGLTFVLGRSSSFLARCSSRSSAACRSYVDLIFDARSASLLRIFFAIIGATGLVITISSLLLVRVGFKIIIIFFLFIILWVVIFITFVIIIIVVGIIIVLFRFSCFRR